MAATVRMVRIHRHRKSGPRRCIMELKLYPERSIFPAEACTTVNQRPTKIKVCSLPPEILKLIIVFLAEAGREFLSNAKMFSQLSPQSSEPVNNGYQAQNRSNSGSNSGSNGFNSRFNGFANYQPPPPAPQPSSFVSRRQTSLPPPTPPPKRYPGCYMDLLPTPSSPQPEVVNSPMRSQPRLTPSQIRRLPPSERPPEPNPSKYTGSHIPSRSFRLLQLITGEDIENQYAEPVEQQQQQSPPVSERTSSVASVSKPIQRPQHQPPLPPTMASSSFNSSFDYGTDF